MTAKIYGWHFVGATLRDGTPIPPDGEWEEFTGDVVICSSGLHGSPTPFDAMKYAPGATLRYCEYENIVGRQNDKFVARRRRTIAKGDATEALRYFAQMQALSVVHLWDAPDVVCDYLMTGDENIRTAARAAAWDAAMAAARAAAWDAARVAAWDAARDAAWVAAWDAARDAAMAAARDAFNELIYECFEDVLA